ncbi:hypothetical protein DDZ13_14450 [Coraliomargarita sinensis]|uniref:Uncharacterized protein n=1 Tax=Coraliomargarita sinensis TaxID=2174842 RepID=A0A317ZCS3_9BACT|nr:hypothetical protein [Coraliomargarita sinensis]PXA02984.1 hypothetical protein DDZ13_14450 [Coraliomargarita sinensis]
MKFKRIHLLHCAVAAALLQSSLYAFEPEIKLTGRKDLVLGIDSREKVLELGVTYLADKKDDYVSKIESLEEPFAFRDAAPENPVANNNRETRETVEPEKVNYDDASVLNVSAASFARKVRGSIARGDTSYLQLEGGTLLKPGTSFPVRIPQAQGQTFKLTITEITSEGYTLQIGEATKQLSFNNNSQSNSIQFSN